MAASFSNPRNAASPCELMRGCSFADNFVTVERTEANNGVESGAGGVYAKGVTLANNAYITYDIVSQPSNFSVTLQFATTTAITVYAPLIGNAEAGTAGFWIRLMPTGVEAQHGNGAEPHDACLAVLDYTDGLVHTVTYVVDMDGGTHTLYVDALTAVSETTAINEEIGDVSAVIVSKYSTARFSGTLYKPRIFDAILTEAEHDLYHAGTIETFFKAPLAAYRCDSFCDDTDGHKIWDRTTALLDLYKADRVASAKFPTLETDKYSFDFVDDYLDNIPVLPANYTITGAVSTPQLPYPTIEQDNDETLTDLLTTEGDYWGYLHSLVIHSAVLTPMQLLHDEYMHLYWTERGRAAGLYHRLITEQTCVLAMFMDAGINVFTDYSREGNSGAGHLVTRDGANGCTFPNADSHVIVPHDASLDLSTGGTVAIYGDFDTAGGASGLLQKGTNYWVSLGINVIYFRGYTFPAHVFDNNHHLAFTFRDGYKVRLFIDGIYWGESNNVAALTPDTSDLTIGNVSTLGDPSDHNIQQIYIGNKPLADREILALYEQAQAIGATAMETGNRIEVEQLFTAVAVNVDINPGGPFQLIDVTMTINIAPTTSEDMTINTLRTALLTTNEHTEDLSLSTDLTHVWRFDKRFADGRTIAVDYTNTDARTITVKTTYQMDQSVV